MNDRPNIPTQFIPPESQHDRPAIDDGPPQPGPYRCPQTTSGICAVRPGETSTAQPCKETCGCYPGADTAPERDAEAVAATPAAPAPNPEAPQPLHAGTYAVYSDNKGGYVLVIGTREGETHHRHLPAAMVKVAEKMAGGNNPLAALFGGAA